MTTRRSSPRRSMPLTAAQQSAAMSMCWSRARIAAAPRRRRRRSPASPKCCWPTMPPMPTLLAEEVAALLVELAPAYTPSPGAGDHQRQEHHAARRRAARCRADLRHRRRGVARHFRAPDLCRQRDRHGAVEGQDKVITVRGTGFRRRATAAAARRSRRSLPPARPACRISSAPSCPSPSGRN